ncbi:hypothetical protein BKA66DRAFT_283289 [Pyrenochaeta sp. MPI-SDFR-AT-0127]|nr:hypothetical protein BKA66DRAFT_283289 [Pyrenochaeta sp. MPI-SDFR-AT-0127]
MFVISFIVLSFGLLAVSLVRLALTSRRSKLSPPGPPTLPIIGNLHQIPTAKAYLQFLQWPKTYGPIVSLKLGSQDLIVLNSAAAVRE